MAFITYIKVNLLTRAQRWEKQKYTIVRFLYYIRIGVASLENTLWKVKDRLQPLM